MSKVEAIKSIETVSKMSADTIDKLGELIGRADDINAIAISSAILAITGVIADTMCNLSRIMCEFMPDVSRVNEEGEHE